MFYIYGNRDPVTGNNRLAVRRLSDDKHGGLAIGPEVFVTGQVQAAIPAVAITTRPFAAIPWERANAPTNLLRGATKKRFSVSTAPTNQIRSARPYPRAAFT